MLAHPGAKSTLANFEQKFGVSGDDFMSKMLKSSGSQAALAEMVKPQVSEAQVAQGFAAEPAGGVSASAPGGDGGRASAPASTFAELAGKYGVTEAPQRGLASGPTPAAAAAQAPMLAAAAKHRPSKPAAYSMEKEDRLLDPLKPTELMVGIKAKESDGSLFEQVRHKYGELNRRLLLGR